jgi:hypothetical protein
MKTRVFFEAILLIAPSPAPQSRPKPKAIPPKGLPKKKAATFVIIVHFDRTGPRLAKGGHLSNRLSIITLLLERLFPPRIDCLIRGQRALNTQGLPIHTPDFSNVSASSTRFLSSRKLSIREEKEQEYPGVLLE